MRIKPKPVKGVCFNGANKESVQWRQMSGQKTLPPETNGPLREKAYVYYFLSRLKTIRVALVAAFDGVFFFSSSSLSFEFLLRVTFFFPPGQRSVSSCGDILSINCFFFFLICDCIIITAAAGGNTPRTNHNRLSLGRCDRTPLRRIIIKRQALYHCRRARRKPRK